MNAEMTERSPKCWAICRLLPIAWDLSTPGARPTNEVEYELYSALFQEQYKRGPWRDDEFWRVVSLPQEQEA